MRDDKKNVRSKSSVNENLFLKNKYSTPRHVNPSISNAESSLLSPIIKQIEHKLYLTDKKIVISKKNNNIKNSNINIIDNYQNNIIDNEKY